MPDKIDIKWNATDGSHRESDAHAENSAPHRITPSQAAPSRHTTENTKAYVRVDPGATSLKGAAFTGIGLVLLSGITFYFGVDYLRASLSQGAEHAVTITAQGSFSPESLQVRPGQSITFTNLHADPQVLKLRDNDDIGALVLFEGESDTMPIPAFVPEGTYVVFSETLPETVTFSLVVSSASANEATNTAFPFDEVLIPNLGDMGAQPAQPPATQGSVTQNGQAQETTEQQQPSPAPASPAPSVPTHTAQQTGNNQEPSVFHVESDGTATSGLQGGTQVPVNPYTVGSGREHVSASSQRQEQLHAGAPLNRPVTQPETGMGLWVFATLAGIATYMGYRATGVKQH